MAEDESCAENRSAQTGRRRYRAAEAGSVALSRIADSVKAEAVS